MKRFAAIVFVMMTSAAAAAERPAWRLDVVGMVDDYTAQRDRESQVDLALGCRLAHGWTPVASYSHEHRFGTNDDRFEVWMYTPGFGPVYGWVSLAATPDNDFLADWEGQIGAEAEWATGTSLNGRVQYRSYPNEHTTAPTLGIRQQLVTWLAIDGGYTLGLSNVESPVDTAMAGISFIINDRWNARLGGTHGRENVPPLAPADVDTLTSTLRWQMTERVGWRTDITYENRENFYERLGVSLGATVRF